MEIGIGYFCEHFLILTGKLYICNMYRNAMGTTFRKCRDMWENGNVMREFINL